MFSFVDGTAMLFWSELVRFGTAPWDESFVLSAEWLPPANDPLSYSNLGAIHGFARATPLDESLSGQVIGELELFVDLSETYAAERDDELHSDGLRLLVGSDPLELLTEGPGVLPLSLVIRSRALVPPRAVIGAASVLPLSPGASDA